MTCQLKLMRVFTFLRGRTYAERVPAEQLDRILSKSDSIESNQIKEELLHSFHLLLSGRLKVTLEKNQVYLDGKLLS